MKNKKRILTTLITSLIFAKTGFAALPGSYVGAGAGYADLSDFSETSQSGGNHIGGKIFAGYNFNPYLGVEASYNVFNTTKYTLDDYDDVTFNYHLKSTSLVAKGYLPFQKSPFELYGFLGAAQVWGNADIDINSNKVASSSNRALLLVGGLGLSYQVMPHVLATIEGMLQGSKSGSSDTLGIPNASLCTVNFVYQFSRA